MKLFPKKDQKVVVRDDKMKHEELKVYASGAGVAEGYNCPIDLQYRTVDRNLIR